MNRLMHGARVSQNVQISWQKWPLTLINIARSAIRFAVMMCAVRRDVCDATHEARRCAQSHDDQDEPGFEPVPVLARLRGKFATQN